MVAGKPSECQVGFLQALCTCMQALASSWAMLDSTQKCRQVGCKCSPTGHQVWEGRQVGGRNRHAALKNGRWQRSVRCVGMKCWGMVPHPMSLHVPEII